jgi:serine O-acetyltransferase
MYRGNCMGFDKLKYDMYRYFYANDSISRISILKMMKTIFFTQGIWAIIVYRYRRWCLYECRNRFIGRSLNAIGSLMQLFVEITTGISIGTEIDIGPGFYIGHFGNIFLGGDTKIGIMCNISHECTVGYAGRGKSYGLPIIGDYVYIAPGVKIIGKIKIGNHVAIGANAVVTKDIPDNAVVVGIPGKIISYNSSKDFISYNENKMKGILV